MSGAEKSMNIAESANSPVGGSTAAARAGARWLLGLGLLGAALTLVGTAVQASNLMQVFGDRGPVISAMVTTNVWAAGLTRAVLIAAAGLLAYLLVNLLAQIADNTRD